MAEGDVTLYTQPAEIHVVEASNTLYTEWMPVSAQIVHRDAGTDGIAYQLFQNFDTWWNGYIVSTSIALVRYDVATKTYLDFNILGGTIPTDFTGAYLAASYVPSLDKIALVWRTRDVGAGTYTYHYSYISESGGTWTVNSTVSGTARVNDEAQSAGFARHILGTETRLFLGGITGQFSQGNSSDAWRFHLVELEASGITIICDGNFMTSGAGSVSTSSNDTKRGRVTDTFSSYFLHQLTTGTGKLWEVKVPDTVATFSDITVTEVWDEGLDAAANTFGRLEDVHWDAGLDATYIFVGNAPTDGTQTLLRKIDIDTSTTTWTVTLDNFNIGKFDYDKLPHRNNITGCTMLCSSYGYNIDGRLSSRYNHVLNLTTGGVSTIHPYAYDYFGTGHETGNYISQSYKGYYDIENEWITLANRVDNTFWRDIQHIDLDAGDGIPKFQILEIETEMFYPNGACLLTGISFGEEKDPLYIDFGAIA